MYKATDREQLRNRIISFMQDSSAFEGLLQIGSGVVGFADIYSDIDLMAGCYDVVCVKAANQQLQQFFCRAGSLPRGEACLDKHLSGSVRLF